MAVTLSTPLRKGVVVKIVAKYPARRGTRVRVEDDTVSGYRSQDFIHLVIRRGVVNHALPEKDNRVTRGPVGNSQLAS